MLSVQGVSKSFGATLALNGVSLEASPGRVLALVGENGSGKSTLMRIMSGEESPDKGAASWKGAKVTGRAPHAYLVHQELALCPHLTGAENILLGIEDPWLSRPSRAIARSREILAQLGFSHVDPSLPAGRLPVSQRQALEIARAVARKAEVVLLDEPTSSLTSEDKESLFRLIARLNDQGVLIVYVSHFLEEVREVAQDVAVLRDGSLVHQGPLEGLTDDRLVALMVGREMGDIFPRSPRQPGEVILSLEDLVPSGSRGQGVSLQVRRGEVVGLAGLTGAGRTELLRAAMRLDRGAKGRVKVGTFSPSSPGDMWRQKAGFVSEERKEDGLALALSIAENIDMPRRGDWLRKPKSQDVEAQKWVEALKIKCLHPGQPVGRLSGGNQQKAAFARLLQAECSLLILDEPTRGIDVGSKADIYRLIDEAAARGCGVLMASSHLPELLGVCDRIGVMNRGQLTMVVDAQEATQETLLAACVRQVGEEER